MPMPTAQTYAFDPTHGFDLAGLAMLRPPPLAPGFDAFWQPRYERALARDPVPRLTRSALRHPSWQVYDLAYVSTDDFPIGGWLLLPKSGTVTRGVIVGHGYGGRTGPDLDLPLRDAAVLFPCLRGLSRSRRPPISDDPAFHVLDNIDKPERYILGGCVEDIWLAVSALLALFPTLKGRIGYMGVSFSGGLGALALAFETRIARAHLNVPTFGNMPLWLTLPSLGSARAVQAYQATHGPVADTLALFDAASAATRIDVPLLVAAARFDPAVAPPCQFSVANAGTTSNRHETVILDAGHVDYPGEGAQHALLREKLRRFFDTS
ncbi:acetylxylan esterase [Ancylobacter radicis]|uniref:Acetylxylan esterase n=1 Tax=Ancylobacter radicis TaxID=2836179 RepID=A0ABS5R8S6_9HYPH|nr:acetylxylan esterase [Ancylobacter radicis]MBS9478073.1 acetylxylan esterase [Ancylobacter radicis]